MNVRRNAAALLVAGLALVAIVAWLSGSSSAPDEAISGRPTSMRSGPSGVDRAEPLRTDQRPGAEPGTEGHASDPIAGSIPDAAVAIGIDANELEDLKRKFSDDALKAKIALNAKRATEEIDRFCELGDKLKKHPLFPDAPGTRDAAVFMASRVDWEGTPARYGSLHVADTLKPRVSGDWLSTVTDTDLAGLDFTWMKQLLAFDVWTFGGDGAAEDLRLSALASNIPNFISLQTQVKLRFSRALRDGDWNDAVLEVRHLAFLVHSMGMAIAEAISVALLKMEVRAREQAARLGIDLSSLPPLEDPALLEAQRTVGVKSGWFVAPGVPEAVRRRALECSALKCTTVLEGLALHSSLRPWAPPGSLDSYLEDTKNLGCDASMMSLLVRMPPATREDLHWLLQDEDTSILPAADAGR